MQMVALFVMALGLGYIVMRRYFSRSSSLGSAVKPVVVKSPTNRAVATSLSAHPSSSSHHHPSSLSVEAPEVRVRSLSTKRSNQPSPLSNLEKLQSLSQSRLPRMSDKPLPKVELTDAERAGIEELKKRIEKDKLPRCKIPGHHASDDAFIGRFVRGKRCDLDAAYAQLKASLKWREENRVDTIREWYRKEYAEPASGIDHYYPWQDHGEDKWGVNCIWDRLPSMDFKLLMNNFTKEDLIYWHIERLEKNMQILHEHGQYGGVFVEDFTGLSMAHWYKPAVEFLKEMMQTDQQNYPELSRAIFYINAPRVLSVLWPLLKPLMDPLTVAKVFIASDSGADQLQQFMPLSSVPVEYGGVCIKCKHEDGKCLDYSLGGPFLSTKKLRYTSISVPARGDAKVSLESVEKLPARLGWKFICAPSTDDVAMEVLNADSGEVLMKVDKTSASEGVLDVKVTGKLMLRFDNSHSYWNSKTVGYSVFLDH